MALVKRAGGTDQIQQHFAPWTEAAPPCKCFIPFHCWTQFISSMKGTLSLSNLSLYKTPTTNCIQYQEKVSAGQNKSNWKCPRDCWDPGSDPWTLLLQLGFFTTWGTSLLLSADWSHPSVADHSPLPLLQLQNVSAIYSMGQNKIHFGRFKGFFENIGIHTLKEKYTWH